MLLAGPPDRASRRWRAGAGRILVVAPQPFYEDRGTPIAVRYLLTALSELGYQVDLLTYPMGDHVTLPGLRIFRVGGRLRLRHVPIGLSLRKLLLDAILVPAMLRRLREQRYDYHCIHAVEEAAFPAIRLGQQHNIPVIYDMQSSMAEQLTKHVVFRSLAVQKRLRLLERWLVANASLVICSAGLETQVRAVHRNAVVREWYFPSAIVPVSSAERESTRQALGIRTETRVVLYAGNAEPYQGLSRIFDAMPKVLAEAPDTVFVLVGINSDRVQKSDGDHLVLVPRRPKEAMPHYLAIADVLVAPRDPLGNFPLKLFDYMASGRPIVATDCDTHRTVLNEDRAVLVSPSAESFAEGILHLLADQNRAEQLGVSARSFAEGALGWNAFVRFVDRAYRRAQQVACEERSSKEH